MKLELHCHTNISPDSNMSIESIEKRAYELGIDVVAITDHGTIQAAKRAQSIWKRIRLIIGEEIITAQGELIGYFLKEEIPYGLSVQETIKRIHGQDGLVSVDHPFCRLRKHPLSRQALDRYRDQIDFIEVFNSRNVFSEDNKKAQGYAQEHHMIPIVGSDAHSITEIGRALIQIDEFRDGEDFKQNMKQAMFSIQKSPLYVHALSKVFKFKHKFYGTK